MTELAKEIGVSRESLYKSLSEDGNPAFSTVLKIFRSFGLRLEVKPADSVVTAD
jgi:probable addiction module antidote protein